MALHEREAVSFWFRRLATTLVLANGAGVIAIGGFVSGKDDLVLASVVAYPALASFITGAIISSTVLLTSLLYSAFRVEAYAQYFLDLKKWKEARGQKTIAYDVIALVGFAFFILQVGALGFGGLYFYAGSKVILSGLGDVACGKMSDLEFCKNSISPIYTTEDIEQSDHRMSQLIVKPQDGQGRKISELQDVFISGSYEQGNFESSLGYSNKIPVRFSVGVRGAHNITLSNSSIVARFITRFGENDESECYFHLLSPYIGGTTPMLINPKFKNMLDHAFSRKGVYSKAVVIFDHPEVTVSYVIGKDKGINFLKITPEGPVSSDGRMSEYWEGHVGALFDENGTLTVFPNENSGPACRTVSRDLNFRVLD